MSHHQLSVVKWAKTRLSTKRSDLKRSNISCLFLSLPLEIRLLIYSYLFGNQIIHIISDCVDNGAPSKSYKAEGWEKELQGCSVCSTNRHREEVTRFWGPPYHRVCISDRFTKEQCEAHRHANFIERNHNYPMLYPIGAPRNNQAGFIGPDVWLQHYGCVKREQDAPTLDLAILRTCRQIYGEARLIPYRTNAFSFDKAWAFARFCGLSLNQLRTEDSKKTTDEKPCVSRRSKLLTFSKYNTTVSKKGVTPSLLSEIRHLQIHAAYDHDHDLRDWRIVCAKASGFFTRLEIFNLSIDLTPHGEPNLPGWIGRDSVVGDGFRAFKSSPLKDVTVNVIDEAWGVYLDDHFFSRSQVAFRTTVEEKEAFAQGIKDHLLKKDQDEIKSTNS